MCGKYTLAKLAGQDACIFLPVLERPATGGGNKPFRWLRSEEGRKTHTSLCTGGNREDEP